MSSERRNLSLQGLLKFAVQQSEGGNAANSTNKELDQESSEFLQNALKSMTVDVIKEFKDAVAILESDDSSLKQKEDSLNNIRSYIDDIDLANNFVNFGGTTTLIHYISAPEKNLRTIAINIIAEMSQNNTFCQRHFLNENVISRLLPYLSDTNENVTRSSIYAISSLIQNFEPGLIEFLRLNGINSLLLCLKSTIPNVYIKTAFLIASLASQHSSIKAEFIKKDIVSILLENIEVINDFDIKLETTLFALDSLSPASEWNITKEKWAETELLLKQIISQNKKLDNCMDIVKYAEHILENLKAQ